MVTFYVNPDTGLVSLKKPLSDTADNTFTVISLGLTILVFRIY